MHVNALIANEELAVQPCTQQTYSKGAQLHYMEKLRKANMLTLQLPPLIPTVLCALFLYAINAKMF